MRRSKASPESRENYVPNEVSLSERVINKVLIAFLLCYGAYGVYSGSLYLPLGRGEVTLEGNAVYFGFASLILGAIYFLVEIIDHYDTRDNEFTYKRIRAAIRGLAVLILLFTCAISFALKNEI
jgi:hypothetical protein